MDRGLRRLHCNCQSVRMNRVRVSPMGWSFPVVLTLWVAQASPLMIPAKNGTICPGGTSYAGAGFCKVRHERVPRLLISAPLSGKAEAVV